MSFLHVLLLISAALCTIEGYPNKQQQFALRRGNVNNYHPDSPCAHYTSALIQAQSQGRIVNRPTRINGEGGSDQLDLAASTTHNAPHVPLPVGGQGSQGYHYGQQYNQGNVAVSASQLAPPAGVPLAPPVSLPIVPPSVPLTPPPLPPLTTQQSIGHQPPPYYLNSQSNINNNNNNLHESYSQYYTKGQYATQSQPVYNTDAYYTKPTVSESGAGSGSANIDFSTSSLNSATSNSYQQNSGSYASSYNHNTFGNSQASFNGYAQSAGNIAGNTAGNVLSTTITHGADSISSSNRNVLDSQLGQVIQETFAQSSLDPSFEKHIYVHVPPEDLEEERTKSESSIPIKVQKHYNIVFIKAPSTAASSNYLLPQIVPQTEEKTLVYVLVKKPDEESLQALQEQLQQTAVKSSKPEVYFIKYKTRTDDNQKPFLREQITQSSESNNYSYAGNDSANSISLATTGVHESGLTSGSGTPATSATLSHSAYGVPLN